MSKARPQIPENIKVALLRETNYRCGCCMMNITPAAYFTENRDKTDERVKKFVEDFNQKNKLAAEGSASILTIAEVNDLLPTYYQSYDCAHIEPYNEEDPATNSFYNLIALCKNCHWKTEPKHSNAIISKEQLKALKLHWMIASGRFTRLEIDVLMELYYYDNSILRYNDGWSTCVEKFLSTLNEEYREYLTALNSIVNFPSNMNINGPQHLLNDFNQKKTQLIEYKQSVNLPRHIEICRPFKGSNNIGVINNHSILISDNLYFLFQKSLNKKLFDLVNFRESLTFSMKQNSFIVSISNDTGYPFCQNFHEAYKELDEIEI